MSMISIGNIRIKHDGVTYYLPPPDKGYPQIEMIQKSTTKELINGSERTRLLGWIPVLTIKYKTYPNPKPYDDFPTLDQLLSVLSNPTNTIKVSPGPANSAFTCDNVNVKAFGVKGGYYTGVEITFRGRDILSNRGILVETF